MDEKKPPEEPPKPAGEKPAESSEAKPKPKPKPKPAKKGVDEAKLRAPVPSKTLDRLNLVHGDAVEDVSFHCGVPIVRVKTEKVVEIGKFLKEDGNCRMTLLANLCGVDMIGLDRPEPRFDVVYNLFSPNTGERITLRVAATEESGIDTVSSIWRTADWHEREAYDMFGIKFNGHPDLRRILMPYDFDAFPLRKDFPLEGRAKDHGYWRRPEDGEGRDLPE